MNRRQKQLEILQELQLKAFFKNRELIGKAQYPSDKEAQKKWENIISSIDPLFFYYVFDLVDARTPYMHNIQLVTQDNYYEFHVSDLTKLYHPNQQLINLYLGHRVHEIFLEFRGKVNDSNFFFVSQRAIKDSEGKFWNARYFGSCFQFDENGYMRSYFIKWSLFTEYKGERVSAKFIYEGKDKEKHISTLKELNDRLREIQSDTFYFLQFTPEQCEVIEQLIKEGSTIKSIAKVLGSTSYNIAKHNTNILSIGRDMFPINKFNTAKDVALYLKEQNIIPTDAAHS